MPLSERDLNASGRTSRASGMSVSSKSGYSSSRPDTLSSNPAVMSMLKTSTEFGDIASLALPSYSRLPPSVRQTYRRGQDPSRLSTSSGHSMKSSKRSSHHRAWPSSSSTRRPSITSSLMVPQRGPEFGGPDITSSPSSPTPVPKARLSNELRSFSMTQTTSPPFEFKDHRSFSSLREPIPPPRPKSPYKYPTRLKRPGYGSVSPILQDSSSTPYVSGRKMRSATRSLYSISISHPNSEPPPLQTSENGSAPTLKTSTSVSSSLRNTSAKSSSEPPPSSPATPKDNENAPVQVLFNATDAKYLATDFEIQGTLESSQKPLYYDYSEQFEMRSIERDPVRHERAHVSAVPFGVVHRIRTILEEKASNEITPSNGNPNNLVVDHWHEDHNHGADVLDFADQSAMSRPQSKDHDVRLSVVPEEVSYSSLREEIAELQGDDGPVELPATPVGTRITREMILEAVGPTSDPTEDDTRTVSLGADLQDSYGDAPTERCSGSEEFVASLDAKPHDVVIEMDCSMEYKVDVCTGIETSNPLQDDQDQSVPPDEASPLCHCPIRSSLEGKDTHFGSAIIHGAESMKSQRTRASAESRRPHSSFAHLNAPDQPIAEASKLGVRRKTVSTTAEARQEGTRDIALLFSFSPFPKSKMDVQPKDEGSALPPPEISGATPSIKATVSKHTETVLRTSNPLKHRRHRSEDGSSIEPFSKHQDAESGRTAEPGELIPGLDIRQVSAEQQCSEVISKVPRYPSFPYPSGHLPGLPEDRQQDLTSEEIKRLAYKFPLPFSATNRASFEPIRISSEPPSRNSCLNSLRKSEALSQTRLLPSLNFSHMDLVSKLNDALDVKSTKSFDGLHLKITSQVDSSPVRPSSASAVRDKYKSFFATLDSLDTGETRKLDNENTETSPSHSPLVSNQVIEEVNRLSVPSVTGLTQRLSELLPSLQRHYENNEQREKTRQKKVIPREAAPGRANSTARLRPLPGKSEMAVVDDDDYEKTMLKYRARKPTWSLSSSDLDSDTDNKTHSTAVESATSVNDPKTAKGKAQASTTGMTRSLSLPAVGRCKGSRHHSKQARRSLRDPHFSMGGSPSVKRPVSFDTSSGWVRGETTTEISGPAPPTLRSKVGSLINKSLGRPSSGTDMTDDRTITVETTYTVSRSSDPFQSANPLQSSTYRHSRSEGFINSSYASGLNASQPDDRTVDIGERYPTTGLTLPSGCEMGEVQSCFSENTSVGRRQGLFQRTVSEIKARTLSRTQTAVGARNSKRGGLNSLSGDSQALNTGSVNTYAGTVGMSRLEFGARKVVDKIKGAWFRLRNPRVRRSEPEDWLADSPLTQVYSGT
ncbi:hypothetical protein M501DRAFT_1004281 [Patellaria atrata CBS 101060]|uniref:Uncharacterized protein n=1 Tax=Patellaria atrata CBS 101060 TaxID=1346257 RepID=A0A9P4SB60_9PEZI|nr:hypothetical protein M501DRAFT_1004281 [Patellaria atrata CBS 101060]